MKFFRYVLGFPLAVIITSLLFLLMYHLIRQEQLPLPESVKEITKPIMPDRDEKERKPKPQPEPDELPEQPDEPDTTNNKKPIKKTPVIDPKPETGDIGDLVGPGGGDPGKVIIRNDAFYAINRVTPLYPASCELRGVEGEVTVEYDVTNGGQVINAKVVSSSDTCLEGAAIRAIQKWKYTPLMGADPDGIRERGLRQTFAFELEDTE